MIAIIDYGMGNIHSVQKALEVMGAQAVVTNKASDIEACDKAVLPGVGAFDDAMAELKKQGLVTAIHNHVNSGKAFLGICLGMQLFFESSEEAPQTQGLGIFEGQVKRFDSKKGLKVPHMGWNQLKISKRDCPFFWEIGDEPFVYFCHSYYGVSFSSSVWRKNIYGVQFHPEKSQKAGLKMLENFVKLC
jgi:glutamine amidotransferase